MSLNGLDFGVFQVRRQFRWSAVTRETRLLGLLGKEGNINFSGTTEPKVHRLVWNSSLGTGLGDGEVELSIF